MAEDLDAAFDAAIEFDIKALGEDLCATNNVDVFIEKWIRLLTLEREFYTLIDKNNDMVSLVFLKNAEIQLLQATLVKRTLMRTERRAHN